MIYKLLRDNFQTRAEEQAFLKEQIGVERVDASEPESRRRERSKALMDRRRDAA